MSRLANPGVGEITDRLTILGLKMLAGKQAGRPIDHFRQERDTLLAQIRSRTLNGVWFDQLLDLAAVNATLWQAEDQLRHYRDVDHQQQGCADPLNYYATITRLAFQIQELNDRRAELVTLINCNAGDGSTEEKLR